MWECQKCHERLEDSFEVCWNCGTSKAGVEDQGFQTADQIEPASLEQPLSRPIEENAYEFRPEQNEVVATLATNMRFVGILSLLAGGGLILVGFVQLGKGGAPALIEGVLALIIGRFTVQAAGAFRRIVDSQGDDIGHLMTALEALRSLYRLQAIILCIAIGFLALAFLVLTLRTVM